MTIIRVITKDSGVGLRKDLGIIKNILSSMPGLTIESVYIDPALSKINEYNNFLQRNKRKLPPAVSRLLSSFELYFSTLRQCSNVDINIFLENIEPQFLAKASFNILIPNQEWTNDGSFNYLPWIDLALCKTEHSQKIFQPLCKDVIYTSFTSEDKKNDELTQDYNLLFHLAGGSLQKGTAKLVDAWSKRPDWPLLKIIQHPKNQMKISYDNISYISGFVDDDALNSIQKSHGCHLCLSEAEGFGHSIVEAMSAEALVMTTNAPPMNEIINESRGLVVDFEHSAPQRLGRKYIVSDCALEAKIDELLGMSTSDKRLKGRNARQWFLENDDFFKNKLIEVIGQLL